MNYTKGIDADDVNGFDYNTGRTFDENGNIREITKEAVLAGDVICTIQNDEFVFYRVVEVSEECILGYCRDNTEMSIEMVQWSTIEQKQDPESVFINENDVMPSNIDQKREP